MDVGSIAINVSCTAIDVASFFMDVASAAHDDLVQYCYKLRRYCNGYVSCSAIDIATAAIDVAMWSCTGLHASKAAIDLDVVIAAIDI